MKGHVWGHSRESCSLQPALHLCLVVMEWMQPAPNLVREGFLQAPPSLCWHSRGTKPHVSMAASQYPPPNFALLMSSCSSCPAPGAGQGCTLPSPQLPIILASGRPFPPPTLHLFLCKLLHD